MGQLIWEFHSIDLNDDGKIHYDEANKIFNSPSLWTFLDKAKELWHLFSDDANVSLLEFTHIYNIMYTLDFFPEASDAQMKDMYDYMLYKYHLEDPINNLDDEIPAFFFLEFVRTGTTFDFLPNYQV